jgi:predicted amidophosphoribosyltransferase
VTATRTGGEVDVGTGWLVLVALVTPTGRAFLVRNVTTRICPVCFERFPRTRRSCPVCRTRVDDFGGAPPPPNPLG